MQKASGKSVRRTHGVSLPWAPAPNTGEGRPGLVPRVQKHKGSGRSSPGIWGGTLGEWYSLARPQVSGEQQHPPHARTRTRTVSAGSAPSGWPGMFLPPPAKARAPCGTGLLRPWGCSSPAGCACLPGGHTCHQASMQSVLPGHWGDAQQLYHFVSSQANLSISYDLLFRNQNVKPLRTRWSEAGGWFWRGGLGLS